MQEGSATNLLFAMLDADGTDRISREEFMQLVTVLRVQARSAAGVNCAAALCCECRRAVLRSLSCSVFQLACCAVL